MCSVLWNLTFERFLRRCKKFWSAKGSRERIVRIFALTQVMGVKATRFSIIYLDNFTKPASMRLLLSSLGSFPKKSWSVSSKYRYLPRGLQQNWDNSVCNPTPKFSLFLQPACLLRRPTMNASISLIACPSSFKQFNVFQLQRTYQPNKMLVGSHTPGCKFKWQSGRTRSPPNSSFSWLFTHIYPHN